MAGTYLSSLGGFRAKTKNYAQSQDQADAKAYQDALMKAVYAQLGPEFSGGLDRITNYLAGAGPLADSGARTALARNLYSQILQRGQGQVLGGVSDIIGNLIKQRRAYQYQSALLKQQKKMQQTGVGGVLGGIAGSVLGPVGGAVGTYIGGKLTGSNSNYPQYV